MDDITQPEKMPLTSLDIAAGKREELRRLLASTFPEVMSEDRIDPDQLKRMLGEWVESDRERFGLNWPGKAACMRVIQAPSVGTLKPCPEQSVEWDTTQNIFIEGDNLEILKLLQKAYFGKIKMIYIDPPYNTGKEFIYPDKYAETLDTYLEYTGQKDSQGRNFSTNTDVSGRFHSRWLNMMYPRLYLAKNLLKQDGIIFISIDDHEISSLRMVMDQVFGEENFISQLVWNTEGHTDNQFDVKIVHEYILVYARDASAASLGFVVDPNTRTESNLWRGFAENSITKNGPANPPSEVDLPSGFPCKADNLRLSKTDLSEKFFSEVKNLGYISRDITRKYDVSYPIRLNEMEVEQGKLKSPCRVYAGWANVNKLKAFIANGCRPLKEDEGELSFFLSENGVIYYQRQRERARNIVSVLRNIGTTEKMRSELEEMGLTYQYPKPKELISYLAKIGLEKNDLILDFFAGSATTAQAVYELNVEQGSGHHFILVQLPEPIPDTSLAFSQGFRNVSELARERIRRSEKKAGVPAGKGGFRSFKLDRSCFKEWDGSGVESEVSLLEQITSHADHVDPNASQYDILFELLLKDGFALTTTIQEITLAGKTVYSIADGALLICLDKQITQEVIDAMADMEPSRVICLDAGFQGNDQLKANSVQTFKARARNRETAIEFRTV